MILDPDINICVSVSKVAEFGRIAWSCNSNKPMMSTGSETAFRRRLNRLQVPAGTPWNSDGFRAMLRKELPELLRPALKSIFFNYSKARIVVRDMWHNQTHDSYYIYVNDGLYFNFAVTKPNGFRDL